MADVGKWPPVCSSPPICMLLGSSFHTDFDLTICFALVSGTKVDVIQADLNNAFPFRLVPDM